MLRLIKSNFGDTKVPWSGTGSSMAGVRTFHDYLSAQTSCACSGHSTTSRRLILSHPFGGSQNKWFQPQVLALTGLLMGSAPLLAAETKIPNPINATQQTASAENSAAIANAAPNPDNALSIEGILANQTLEPDYATIELRIDAGERDGIERQLVDDIREIELATDRYNPALVEPLRLVGKLLHADERYPEAAAVFARGTQISRLNSGLHSTEQLDLVYSEIDSLIAMGSLLEANSRHEYAFSVARRAYGNFSVDIVPVLLRLADWYVETGNLFAARGHYIHARNLLSTRQSTTNSDAMITALRGMARSFRDERFPTFVPGTSEDALELAEKNAIYNDQSSGNLQSLRLSVNSFQRGTQALKNIVAIEERRLIVLALTRQQAQREAAETAAAKKASLVAADTQTSDAAIEAQPAAFEETEDLGAEELGVTEDAPRPDRDPTAANPIVVQSSIDPNAVVVSEVLDPLIRDPSVDKSAFLNSIVELADWYLLMEKSRQAFGYYRHAYRIAAADPTIDVKETFGEPRLLYVPPVRDPSVPKGSSPSAKRPGYVDLAYEIDANGAVKKLKTIASEPQGQMVFPVRRALTSARYRPRIVDGFPQPTTGFSFRHNYEYVPKSTNPSNATARGQGD